MTKNTIAALLKGGSFAASEEHLAAARAAARLAWASERIEALKTAQKSADAAWERLLEGIPEDMADDEFEALDLPDPPEQAELDAIHAEIEAVTKHDRCPRELYWSL